MKYENVVKAEFVDRPNRFIAHVRLEDGTVQTVHVKNTGRCAELLYPGVSVMLQDFGEETARKTRYDLISVYKESLAGWINIDSQAPNKVVREWLEEEQDRLDCYDLIRPEYTYGESRIDFYLEQGDRRILMEVKGCTLERERIGYFPDAPTERGVKHIHELAKAISEGYTAILAFVIQMEQIFEVRPNIEMHPEFGVALEEAKQTGVKVLFLPCEVREDYLKIVGSCLN